MGVQMHWYASEHEVAIDAQAPIVLGRSFSAKEFLGAQKVYLDSILNLITLTHASQREIFLLVFCFCRFAAIFSINGTPFLTLWM